MNWKQHLLGGLIITIIIALPSLYYNLITPNLYNLIIIVLVWLTYSLLPDIDIGTSKIRKFYTIIVALLIIYSLLYSHITFGIVLASTLIFIQFLKHRGLSHSFIFGLLVSAPLYFYFDNYMLAIIAYTNFLSHLVLDRKE